MMDNILFAPLLPFPVLIIFAVLACVVTIVAAWRGLTGWPLRLLGFGAIGLTLLNPSLREAVEYPLTDIVAIVVDETSSQTLPGRTAQTAKALDDLQTALQVRGDTDVRVARVQDDASGTNAVGVLSEMMADIPQNRFAGGFVITDGVVHDMDLPFAPNAPIHALLTGTSDDWDRRLSIQNAPAFGIVGEPLSVNLRIDDLGMTPTAGGAAAVLNVSIDGGATQTFNLPVGTGGEIELTLDHGGTNVLQIWTPNMEGELTDRNNMAVLRINGVRDRLRVLLVSGEPHAGERTWRNLLKSDAQVDLVHFTILRPPGKGGGVSITEMSLIAFPTRELFIDKIDEFDLIIFDRYKRRGILPGSYLGSVAQYVEKGGAVLIAAGPDFASADSLYRSPLSDVIPAVPSARVIEAPYLPKLSDIGDRHPITQGLQTDTPWGRWLRQIEATPTSGSVLMTGIDEKPLLIVDRMGEGRAAVLASDHAWLWDRGFEGGGPQRELLRRLAHWMMKEPDLEEEALFADEANGQLVFTRRSLSDEAPDTLQVTGPDGQVYQLEWTEKSPGTYSAQLQSDVFGLYRATDGTLQTVTALGPASPIEFQETIATGTHLAPMIALQKGGTMRLEDGFPRIRTVREGRPAAGRGWVGIYRKNAVAEQSVTLHPILPAWAYLLLAASLMIGAWLWEGRRA
ncbi:MAG: glutamine amidotransferase [Planktomarina sp.]